MYTRCLSMNTETCLLISRQSGALRDFDPPFSSPAPDHTGVNGLDITSTIGRVEWFMKKNAVVPLGNGLPC